MFREFFCSGSKCQLTFAWCGLFVFVGHSVFKAYLKAALNQFYGRFYDSMQERVVDLSNGANMTDADRLHLQSKRLEINDLLIEFCWIVAPSLLVHPIAKFVGSFWKFNWRISLVNSYLAHTDVNSERVPNSAQRIHEDTMRFESGIYSAVSILLDSTLTLVVFIPILIDCGKEAHPDWIPDWIGDSWLTLIAVQSALYGVSISVFVGRKLVDLEIKNQDVEAKLRTKLVLLEEMPTSFVEDSILAPPDSEVVMVQARIVEDSDSELQTTRTPTDWNPLHAFVKILCELRQNYRQLFIEFAKFNSWVSLFDQALVIAPYFLVAPLLFSEDPVRRITLGTLTRVVNAFEKVFSSLSVVAESWADINDFRSVLRRLRFFEQRTYSRRAFSSDRVYSQVQEGYASALPTSFTRHKNNLQEIGPPSETELRTSDENIRVY